jgi:hypothetical protein
MDLIKLFHTQAKCSAGTRTIIVKYYFPESILIVDIKLDITYETWQEKMAFHIPSFEDAVCHATDIYRKFAFGDMFDEDKGFLLVAIREIVESIISE